MTNVALVLASSRHCATAWAASSGGGPPIPAGVEALGDDVAAIAAWLERPTSQDDGR